MTNAHEVQPPPPPATEPDLTARWAQRAHAASIVDTARLRVPNAPVANYSEDRWPLQALGDAASDNALVFVQQRRRKAASMGWRDVEPEWRESLKRLAWMMLNQPLPEHLLTLPHSNYRARPGAGTIQCTINGAIKFLRWLREQPNHATVTEIRHVDQRHLQAWVAHIHARKLSQPSVYTRPLTYLWAWGHAGELPATDVLVRPFWVGQESAVLRTTTHRGEGREPLTQSTMDPLIWWAVEFVERFSGDCLRPLAWFEDIRTRLDLSSTVGQDITAAARWLRSLPEHPRWSDNDTRRDVAYLTAISAGLSYRSVWSGLDKLRAQPETLPPLAEPGTPKPLPVTTTATINGDPWLDLDWRHVSDQHGRQTASRLRRAVQGACAVVIGYLGAGPRPLELRSLQRDCLTVSHHDGGAVRYYITGRIRKNERDFDDQTGLDGVEHRWPALPQAARAIELLERLPTRAGSTVLFADPDGRELDGAGVNKTIQVFIDLANEIAARHNLPVIAEDPGGVTAGRLRRTIGPFIRNRPDGAFALAVVYGHTSSVIGAHYGGMKQTGSTRFLPRETADHIATTLNTINASLDQGGGLSGPAAPEALTAASTFRGAILTSRDWKKILANPEIQTYDNPDSAVGCRFDPTSRPPCQNDTALDARTEPDLTNCHTSCGNRFYTDNHAHTHERTADQLDSWAELAPTPEAARLRRKAGEHRAAAQHHWASRIGVDGTPLQPSKPDPSDR